MINLSVQIGSIKLKNPVMPASGTFGYGSDFIDFFDPNILGAIVLKGVSVRRVEGNPSPRIYETPAGMLNAIGLQNVGYKALVEEKLPKLDKVKVPIIANIWGTDEKDYLEIAEKLGDEEKISGMELNISCPNIRKGGLEFGSNSTVAADLTGKIRRRVTKPLWVKISPSAPGIGDICRAVEDAGADAISLINSIPAMSVDIRSRRPHLANIIGGLSGPAIRPIAVRMVYQAAKAVKIPVIGIGGITSAEDALQFLIVGASAVQVGTASFINPNVFEEIIGGLEAYCKDMGITAIRDIIDTLEVNR